MGRNNQKPVELARCPQCNALCVNGHDVDNQIYCAKCGRSYVPKSYIEMTDEEFRAMTEKALQKHGGNRKAAAKELGISERTIYRKLDQMKKKE